jgi:hypothetical protein
LSPALVRVVALTLMRVVVLAARQVDAAVPTRHRLFVDVRAAVRTLCHVNRTVIQSV